MALTAALLALLALPLAPVPGPPFPKIVTDAPVITDVAPGVQYGEYRMRTADGPLAVHVIAIDLRNASVRIGTTLAQNRLVSSGETTSSMGARTGAIAGVNGDYFDINQTNQPLNILIGNSHLIRMPMQRWAIAFGKDNAVTFGEYKIAETATLPNQTLQLNTMNDWPPPGDQAVLITPEYG
ncbi:MAG TPA: hypothetical protein VFE17_11310, partial [Candidatus Baltobacteraceae bacterium]|nr:hypothetical protein [Candidatus Baltobacteraceae bacterium]